MAAEFLGKRAFAVVGASADRSKFGNRLLRRYAAEGMRVVPVHPKATEIEGIPVQQLSELEQPEEWGVSVVTPPAVTLKAVQAAHELGFRAFWLQPGAESPEVVEALGALPDVQLIAGGPCVLVELDRGTHKKASM